MGVGVDVRVGDGVAGFVAAFVVAEVALALLSSLLVNWG